MARKATTNLSLGTWAQNENPGAGSQSVKDGAGLNNNWLILDEAVGTEHTAAGAHKSNVIDKGNLKTTVCDATTIEKDASVGLRIKDSGVSKAKLNTDVADGSSIEKDSGVGLRIKASGVQNTHLLASGTTRVMDNSSINQNASGQLQVADDGITAPKISHDNNRTKFFFGFAGDSSVTGAYGKFNGVACNSAMGPVMPRNGAVTKMTICSGGGNVQSITIPYSASAFLAGHRIRAQVGDYGMGGDQYVAITDIDNSTEFTSGNEAYFGITGASAWMVVVEVEFDD